MKSRKCLGCKKYFTPRKYYGIRAKQKFCSQECIYINTRVLITCSKCNKNFYRKKSALKKSKSGFFFCNLKCKSSAQKIIGGIKEIMPPHYGTSNGIEVYKNLIKNKKSAKCVSCKESNKLVLEIHHKDKNRNNNLLTNLEIVCANCHKLRHLKFIDGSWRFNYKYLTPRNKLKSLTLKV